MSGVEIQVSAQTDDAKRRLEELNASLAKLFLQTENLGGGFRKFGTAFVNHSRTIVRRALVPLIGSVNGVVSSFAFLGRTAVNALQGIISASGRLLGGLFSLRRSVGMLIVSFLGLKAGGYLNKVADDLVNIQNYLSIVLKTQDQVLQKQRQIMQIGRESRGDWKQATTTFVDLKQTLSSLQGMDDGRILSVIKTLNQMNALSGSSPAVIESAMVQLNQGLSMGSIQGRELLSIMKYQKFLSASMMKELNMSAGELRDFGSKGQISPEVFVKVLEASAERTQEAFDRTQWTVALAARQFKLSLGFFFGDINQYLRLSESFARRLLRFSDALESATDRAIIQLMRMRLLMNRTDRSPISAFFEGIRQSIYGDDSSLTGVNKAINSILGSMGAPSAQKEKTKEEIKLIGKALYDGFKISINNISASMPVFVRKINNMFEWTKAFGKIFSFDTAYQWYAKLIPLAHRLEQIAERTTFYLWIDRRVERAWYNLFKSKDIESFRKNLEALNMARKAIRVDSAGFFAKEMYRKTIQPVEFGFKRILMTVGLMERNLKTVGDTRFDKLLVNLKVLQSSATRLYRRILAPKIEPYLNSLFVNFRKFFIGLEKNIRNTFTPATGRSLGEGLVNGIIFVIRKVYSIIRDIYDSLISRERLEKELHPLFQIFKTLGIFIREFFFGIILEVLSKFRILDGIRQKIISMFSSVKQKVEISFSFEKTQKAFAFFFKMIRDIYEVTEKGLKLTFQLLANFAASTISIFATLFDRIIGNSFWIDTIDGINSYTKELAESENLLSRFATKVKDFFSQVYQAMIDKGIFGKDLFVRIRLMFTLDNLNSVLSNIANSFMGFLISAFLLFFGGGWLRFIGGSFMLNLFNVSIEGFVETFKPIITHLITWMSTEMVSGVARSLISIFDALVAAIPNLFFDLILKAIPFSETFLGDWIRGYFENIFFFTNRLLLTVGAIIALFALLNSGFRKTASNFIFGKEAKKGKKGQLGVLDYGYALVGKDRERSRQRPGLVASPLMLGAGALALGSMSLDNVSPWAALSAAIPLLAFGALGLQGGKGVAKTLTSVFERVFISVATSLKTMLSTLYQQMLVALAASSVGFLSSFGQRILAKQANPLRSRIRAWFGPLASDLLAGVRNYQLNRDQIGKITAGQAFAGQWTSVTHPGSANYPPRTATTTSAVDNRVVNIRQTWSTLRATLEAAAASGDRAAAAFLRFAGIVSAVQVRLIALQTWFNAFNAALPARLAALTAALSRLYLVLTLVTKVIQLNVVSALATLGAKLKLIALVSLTSLSIMLVDVFRTIKVAGFFAAANLMSIFGAIQATFIKVFSLAFWSPLLTALSGLKGKIVVAILGLLGAIGLMSNASASSMQKDLEGDISSSISGAIVGILGFLGATALLALALGKLTGTTGVFVKGLSLMGQGFSRLRNFFINTREYWSNPLSNKAQQILTAKDRLNNLSTKEVRENQRKVQRERHTRIVNALPNVLAQLRDPSSPAYQQLRQSVTNLDRSNSRSPTHRLRQAIMSNTPLTPQMLYPPFYRKGFVEKPMTAGQVARGEASQRGKRWAHIPKIVSIPLLFGLQGGLLPAALISGLLALVQKGVNRSEARGRIFSNLERVTFDPKQKGGMNFRHNPAFKESNLYNRPLNRFNAFMGVDKYFQGIFNAIDRVRKGWVSYGKSLDWLLPKQTAAASGFSKFATSVGRGIANVTLLTLASYAVQNFTRSLHVLKAASNIGVLNWGAALIPVKKLTILLKPLAWGWVAAKWGAWAFFSTVMIGFKGIIAIAPFIAMTLWGIFGPILSMLAPFLGIGAIWLAFFGPGNTFFEKLQWAWDALRKMFGLTPSTSFGRMFDLLKKLKDFDLFGFEAKTFGIDIDFAPLLAKLDFDSMSARQYTRLSELFDDISQNLINIEKTALTEGRPGQYTLAEIKEIEKMRNDVVNAIMRQPQYASLDMAKFSADLDRVIFAIENLQYVPMIEVDQEKEQWGVSEYALWGIVGIATTAILLKTALLGFAVAFSAVIGVFLALAVGIGALIYGLESFFNSEFWEATKFRARQAWEAVVDAWEAFTGLGQRVDAFFRDTNKHSIEDTGLREVKERLIPDDYRQRVFNVSDVIDNEQIGKQQAAATSFLTNLSDLFIRNTLDLEFREATAVSAAAGNPLAVEILDYLLKPDLREFLSVASQVEQVRGKQFEDLYLSGLPDPDEFLKTEAEHLAQTFKLSIQELARQQTVGNLTRRVEPRESQGFFSGWFGIDYRGYQEEVQRFSDYQALLQSTSIGTAEGTKQVRLIDTIPKEGLNARYDSLRSGVAPEDLAFFEKIIKPNIELFVKLLDVVDLAANGLERFEKMAPRLRSIRDARQIASEFSSMSAKTFGVTFEKDYDVISAKEIVSQILNLGAAVNELEKTLQEATSLEDRLKINATRKYIVALGKALIELGENIHVVDKQFEIFGKMFADTFDKDLLLRLQPPEIPDLIQFEEIVLEMALTTDRQRYLELKQEHDKLIQATFRNVQLDVPLIVALAGKLDLAIPEEKDLDLEFLAPYLKRLKELKVLAESPKSTKEQRMDFVEYRSIVERRVFSESAGKINTETRLQRQFQLLSTFFNETLPDDIDVSEEKLREFLQLTLRLKDLESQASSPNLTNERFIENIVETRRIKREREVLIADTRIPLIELPNLVEEAIGLSFEIQPLLSIASLSDLFRELKENNRKLEEDKNLTDAQITQKLEITRDLTLKIRDVVIAGVDNYKLMKALKSKLSIDEFDISVLPTLNENKMTEFNRILSDYDKAFNAYNEDATIENKIKMETSGFLVNQEQRQINIDALNGATSLTQLARIARNVFSEEIPDSIEITQNKLRAFFDLIKEREQILLQIDIAYELDDEEELLSLFSQLKAIKTQIEDISKEAEKFTFSTLLTGLSETGLDIPAQAYLRLADEVQQSIVGKIKQLSKLTEKLSEEEIQNPSELRSIFAEQRKIILAVRKMLFEVIHATGQALQDGLSRLGLSDEFAISLMSDKAILELMALDRRVEEIRLNLQDMDIDETSIASFRKQLGEIAKIKLIATRFIEDASATFETKGNKINSVFGTSLETLEFTLIPNFDQLAEAAVAFERELEDAIANGQPLNGLFSRARQLLRQGEFLTFTKDLYNSLTDVLTGAFATAFDSVTSLFEMTKKEFASLPKSVRTELEMASLSASTFDAALSLPGLSSEDMTLIIEALGDPSKLPELLPKIEDPIQELIEAIKDNTAAQRGGNLPSVNTKQEISAEAFAKREALPFIAALSASNRLEDIPAIRILTSVADGPDIDLKYASRTQREQVRALQTNLVGARAREALSTEPLDQLRLQREIAAYIEELQKLSDSIGREARAIKEAGDTFASEMESSIKRGLTGLLKGERDDDKGYIETFVKNFVDDFTNTVINTFVDAMMDPFTGENGIITELGKTLGGAIRGMFMSEDEEGNKQAASVSLNKIGENVQSLFSSDEENKQASGFSLTGLMRPRSRVDQPIVEGIGQLTDVNVAGTSELVNTNIAGTEHLAGTFTSGLAGLTVGLGALIGGLAGGSTTGALIGAAASIASMWAFGGFFNKGGWVNGPAGVDKVPAMLTAGEYVVNATAAKEYGGLLSTINTGGLVTTPVQTSTTRTSNANVFNINITGDISRQTQSEIYKMLPNIAEGVNGYNREKGY